MDATEEILQQHVIKKISLKNTTNEINQTVRSE